MSDQAAETRREFETHSARETEALGERLARALAPPALVILSGELGAGKTCFVRGMLRGLDAPPDVRVTSPTYVLQHVYEGGRATVVHIDAYRIANGASEFEASGLLESLDDANTIVCVEWPEKLPGLAWPADRVLVEIEHREPTVRTIALHGIGAHSSAAVHKMDP
ncbi:MAG TPA: tRNA (adenosine(37)-N6)-threonylcarbamoyltransferase complex ATPase subunit type 1 TsaE [Planctomycetota bacterium]|nr:tRNA (adenosine(37)-N6)-threonylcarbamoyltransferase complex ATPase subunit type 1 TsaE [Planctomycetota bacterium]